ncbi:MAG: hypothetical protein LBB48_06875 [Treponema sp.]|jgi:uncharacterized HAD superfamily protein/hypoxanthine phosphoribosyltransferase|nr:hypothetical protein [Treponema sp.]
MLGLHYKTYSDLLIDIKKNINKLPSGIDLVVGVPRSGMIPAYMIGFALNTKVCSFDEFMYDIDVTHGQRPLKEPGNTVLIVDDSSCGGNSMKRVKQALPAKDTSNKRIYFAAVYVTEEAKQYVDSWFVFLPPPRMFQWNYMNHGYIERSCFDIDGVLCVDPAEEENDDGDNYRHFIRTAKPLYIPRYKIYALVTSRLEKYRKETEQWLEQNNVQYEHLYMLDLPGKEERIRLNAHAKFKAEIYRRLGDAVLFYESSVSQAHEIATITQKAVFCVETDELVKNPVNFSTQGMSKKQKIKKIVKKVLKIILFKKSWRKRIREIIKRTN